MADKCGKCNISFQSTEICAKCVECKANFHPACTRLGSTQNFTKAKKSSWKCDLCKDESGSVRSCDDVQEDRSVILAALSTMKSELIGCMDSKLGDVRVSIDSLTEEFKALNNKFLVLEKNQDDLNGRCNKLESVTSQTCSDMREMQRRVLDLQQYSRVANVEIQGMPLTQGEDVYLLLQDLAAALGVPYLRQDISVAHRLRRYSKRLSQPPIIIQFVSRAVKETWISAARRKRGLTATEVSANLPASRVFVNDHLTADNKALLGRARRLLREKKLHYAGYSNGKILVKAKEGEETQRVIFNEDLDMFDP